ncbi:MAG TPA: cell wall hydrolase [Sphingomonas sp.]|nr:cell wall hydrolase [Sphingomonas sp.]
MFTKRLSTLATGGAIVLTICGAAIPASISYAAETVSAPRLTYDLTATAPADAAAAVQPAVQPAAVSQNDVDAVQSPAAVDAASVECMAKVVLHEAGNQPRVGKIAVAQTLVNRLKAGGRFGGSICEVVNQKGQFFRIASFRPRRDTDGWQEAVEVAHEVLADRAEPVAPGAMFFRANYARTNAFFRTRQRVTTVGAHVFYR